MLSFGTVLHILEGQAKYSKKGMAQNFSLSLMGIILFLCLFSVPLLAAEKKQINIEIGKGTIVKFKTPAASVFVANPEIADIQVKSPTLVYIFGKKQGETSLYAVSKYDTVIFDGNIAVNHNLNGINTALKSIIPNSNIEVKSFEGLLILTGDVKNPSQAEEASKIAYEFIGTKSTLINKINIATPLQVNLRVRIAEVGRDTMKRLGINWENLFNNGTSAAIGLFSGGAATSVTISPESSALTGAFNFGNLNLNLVLEMMETEGVLSVLAEPNLTALSGEEASFLAGGEYPIPMYVDRKLVIEYKQFGVSLNFLPTVLESGRINLKIRPEVSQLSSNGAVTIDGLTIPALSTRKVETTIELGSGQSFAIAGLLQNNTNNDITKFPFLGDLPIIGSLFRSSQFQRRETELVIIVTPYIVQPHNGGSMPVPTDNLVIASDSERYLKGRIFAKRNMATPAATVMQNTGKRKISTGFMLD